MTRRDRPARTGRRGLRGRRRAAPAPPHRRIRTAARPTPAGPTPRRTFRAARRVRRRVPVSDACRRPAGPRWDATRPPRPGAAPTACRPIRPGAARRRSPWRRGPPRRGPCRRGTRRPRRSPRTRRGPRGGAGGSLRSGSPRPARDHHRHRLRRRARGSGGERRGPGPAARQPRGHHPGGKRLAGGQEGRHVGAPVRTGRSSSTREATIRPPIATSGSPPPGCADPPTRYSPRRGPRLPGLRNGASAPR